MTASKAYMGWETLKKVSSLIDPNSAKVDLKADALIGATMERIADVLPTASQVSLQSGVIASRQALEAVTRAHSIDKTSVEYVAGRLAAATDVLGYASSRSASDEAIHLAQRAPYSNVLAALAAGPMSNVELATRLDRSEEHACRLLGILRDAELVSSQKRGRERFNTLTPIGRLAVEMGVQERQRVPLQATKIHDLSAERFNMANAMPARSVSGSQLPLLKVKTG